MLDVILETKVTISLESDFTQKFSYNGIARKFSWGWGPNVLAAQHEAQSTCENGHLNSKFKEINCAKFLQNLTFFDNDFEKENFIYFS